MYVLWELSELGYLHNYAVFTGRHIEVALYTLAILVFELQEW